MTSSVTFRVSSTLNVLVRSPRRLVEVYCLQLVFKALVHYECFRDGLFVSARQPKKQTRNSS